MAHKMETIFGINKFDITWALDNADIKVTNTQLVKIASIMSENMRGQLDDTFWDIWHSCLVGACKEVLNIKEPDMIINNDDDSGWK